MPRLRLVYLILLFCISGCVTASKITRENIGPIFYPSAPDAPRIQFLAAFSSSADFEGSPSTFRKFIIGDEKERKPIVKPYGVAVDGHKIYLCDTVNNTIVILDFSARKFSYFNPKGRLRLLEPINLAFDDSGNMYIADAGLGEVVIFDKDGNFLGSIDRQGELKPTGVLISGQNIYICDLKTHSVKAFDLKSRQYLFSLPRENASEEANLFSPTNIAADAEGNIYVSDTGAFRVQKYSPSGEFLRSIGAQGDSLGRFARPKGIAIDKNGRIYCVDAAFENVQVFNKQAKLLFFFGEPASPAALVLPAGIAIDYSLKEYFTPLADPGFEIEYLVLVTSQYGDRKLSVFGFGHKK
ncbi:MAG: hypothetical protein Q7K98_07900 [Candidatus Omnitrophota bacterium]|nr:hypothetical protein [Candidatus Omnitrophota bacterium]